MTDMQSISPGNIIGRRLFRQVLIFAVLLTIVLSVIIGFFTYNLKIKEIEQTFDLIRQTSLDSIRTNLWVDDKEHLQMELKGICQLKSIEYAAIRSKGKIVCEAGREISQGPLTRSYSISHSYDGTPYPLGELYLRGSESYVNRDIFQALLTVTITQTVTILLVAAFILFITYRVVGKRLLRITAYANALTPESLDTPLDVEQKGHHADELDQLAQALSQMRESLYESFKRQKEVEAKLEEHRKNLEKDVEQRTASLSTANKQLQIEINERIQLEKEREKIISELKEALNEVKILSGMLPICSHCKKIRDDKGYWSRIESYITQHSEAQFSHGICPECAKKYYPDFDLNNKKSDPE